MTRIVKEPEVRRAEIIDAAQRLVYTRGFEQMTIQDILDEIHLSKGAFYHYFDSKQALLEALTERSMSEAIRFLDPILNDTAQNAIEKLNCYFGSAMRWKTTQKSYMVALLSGWYSDDNAIVRQKVTSAGYLHIAPMIESIVRQGVQEGLLNTQYPGQAAQLVMALSQNLADSMGAMLLSGPPGSADLAQVENYVAAFTDAMERLLGAAPGALKMIDIELVKEWFI